MNMTFEPKNNNVNNNNKKPTRDLMSRNSYQTIRPRKSISRLFLNRRQSLTKSLSSYKQNLNQITLNSTMVQSPELRSKGISSLSGHQELTLENVISKSNSPKRFDQLDQIERDVNIQFQQLHFLGANTSLASSIMIDQSLGSGSIKGSCQHYSLNP